MVTLGKMPTPKKTADLPRYRTICAYVLEKKLATSADHAALPSAKSEIVRCF